MVGVTSSSMKRTTSGKIRSIDLHAGVSRSGTRYWLSAGMRYATSRIFGPWQVSQP